MPFWAIPWILASSKFILAIYGQQTISPSFLPFDQNGAQISPSSSAERILPFTQNTMENQLKFAKSIHAQTVMSNTGNEEGMANENEHKNRPLQIFSIPVERISTHRTTLRLNFKRYANLERRMQNLTTCACDGRNCPRDGKSNHNPCYFSFAAIVSGADQVIDFRFTPFIVVDGSGIIDGNKEPDWVAQLEFKLPAKPQFIEIYAFNLGPVFSSVDGHVISWAETVWPVDAWTLDLDEFVPGNWMDTPMTTPREIAGRFVGSSLSLEYSVQCVNEFMGPKCDLKCTNPPPQQQQQKMMENTKLYGGINRISSEVGGRPPNAFKNSAVDKTICESTVGEKIYYECQYSDVRRFQVDRCKYCQFGVINKSICVHDSVLWKDQPDNNELFRIATICLAAALAILLLILVVTCIFCWLFCRRNSSSKIGRQSADLGTYRRGIGAPYNISENGFGNNRLADPITHPLLLQQGHHRHKANDQILPPLQFHSQSDWAKPQQPPLAVRNILVHPQAYIHSPQPPVASSSPNTSESDFRPSPFTPRREAQV